MSLFTGQEESAANNPLSEKISMNFRTMEKHEWWLWSGAVSVTLLLAAGLASFLLPGLPGINSDESTFLFMPQIVRGLLGLVLIFDIYTLYQQLKIDRIRGKLVQREELFRLIGENAADLIAVVDMQGHRIYNSLSYEKVLGYTLEELRSSSSFEQIHPEDRARVKEGARPAGRTFDLPQHAGISSSPVHRSPEEGECASATREDICGLAKGRRDLIVGISSGRTANPPECASGAKLSLAHSSNIRIWKTLGRQVMACTYRSTNHAIVSANRLLLSSTIQPSRKRLLPMKAT
jgi:PAS domain-containing protein